MWIKKWCVNKRDGVPKLMFWSQVIFGVVIGIISVATIGFKPIALVAVMICYDLFTDLWMHVISWYIVKQCTMEQLDCLHSWYECDWHRYYGDKEFDTFDSYVRKRIKALKDEKKALKKNAEPEQIEMKTVMKSQSTNFDQGIKMLRKFEYMNSNIPERSYEKIWQKAVDLSNALEKNPKGYVFVDTTFTVFTEEFIALLTSFRAMGSDIDKENKEKMKTLLKSYSDYLDRTIDKVRNQNQTNVDVAYDVIIKNLNKTNNEGGDQIG